MTRGGGRFGPANVAALACLAATGLAHAESHRVAAVDPDAQLTRALDVALSAWGASIVEVRSQAPGATMPIAVDRARIMAREAGADVVVWVSSAEDGYALWIYDAASDHASARELDSPPPFDAATAAGVALAVKTLLRATVVAPPGERFGAPETDGAWTVGAFVGGSARLGTSLPIEGRLGLHAAVWPAPFSRRVGLSLDLETGSGSPVMAPTFSGRIADAAARLAVATRVPVGARLEGELSVGAAAHRVNLDGVVLDRPLHVSATRIDATIEPRLGVELVLLHGRLRLEPWFGLTLWTQWQRFFVHGSQVVDLAPVGLEGALRAALAFP